jgi:phosphocarrier protein HPr
MLEAKVRLTNRLGLHARAAAQLVRLAKIFESIIEVQRDDNGLRSNAKSILGLLNISASQGAELTVTAEGVDEAAAIEAVKELFAAQFGED